MPATYGMSRVQSNGVLVDQSRVIAVNRGEGRLIETRQGRQSHVIGINQGEARFIEERYVGERIVNISTRQLEERVISGHRPEVRRSVRAVETYEDEPIIKEVYVDKEVEVIIERRVPVERYVDVEYEVIVEKPIEKIIEKEIEIEKIMEREVEKIVEVPIERIVEIPIEKVIEVPVEYERRVEVPYERIVEKQVNDYQDNLIYHDNYVDCDINNLHMYPNAEILPTEVRIHEQERIVENPIYVDNIIERIVDVPIDKIIEVPVQRIVEKPVEHIVERPVYIDNIIERIVEIPVEKVIEKPVEHIVEVPVYYDNIIEKPVPIEKIVEQIIEVPVEHIVEQPVYVDNIIEKRYDNIIENPVAVENIIEIPLPQYINHEVPVESVNAQPSQIIVDNPVPVERIKRVPVEYIVHKENPVAVENLIEIQVPNFNQNTHENIINKEVLIERVVERPVPIEKIIEVIVERKIENPIYIEKIIEIPRQIDTVIEQKYDVIVQNIIEVEVEKIIKVPVKTYTAQPVERRNHFEEEIIVNTTVIVPVEGTETQTDHEVNDADLDARIHNNRNAMDTLVNQNNNLKGDLANIEDILRQNPSAQYNQFATANANLRAQKSELESRLNIVQKDKDRLIRDSHSRTVTNIAYNVVDPNLGNLTHELQALLAENQSLISQVQVAPQQY